MANVEIKFGDWIQRGLDLYKDNFGLLVLSSLITIVLSCTVVLAGPMIAGLCMITLALHDKKEPKPEVGDLFKGFDVFLNAMLLGLILFAIKIVTNFLLYTNCLGSLIGVVVGLSVSTLFAFSIFLIADKKADLSTAIQESIEIAKQAFMPLLGLVLVAAALGAAGIIACGIGVIFTWPIYFCVLSVAYRDLFSASAGAVQTIEPEAPAAADEEAKSE